jgi:RimJ/RimL family protein N-acetyltransferase
LKSDTERDGRSRINTDRLDIVQLSVSDIQLLVDGRPEHVEQMLEASFPRPFSLPPLMGEALPFICGWILEHPGAHWWQPWFFAQRERRLILGLAGFSGPNELGVLQLGYSVYREHQGHGYATEAAAALIKLAWADSSITAIQATIPPWNAESLRVADKLGMSVVGEGTDDEVGKILIYELLRPLPPTPT